MESDSRLNLLGLPTELRLLIIEYVLYHGPEPLDALDFLGFRVLASEDLKCNMTVTLPTATLQTLAESHPQGRSSGRFWLPLTRGLGGVCKKLRGEVEDVWARKLVTASTWLSFLIDQPTDLLHQIRHASFSFSIVSEWSPALQPGHRAFPLTPWLSTLQEDYCSRLATLQSLMGEDSMQKVALDFVLTFPPVVTVRFPPGWSGLDPELLADLVATLMGKQLSAFRQEGAWPGEMVLVEPDKESKGPEWRRPPEGEEDDALPLLPDFSTAWFDP